METISTIYPREVLERALDGVSPRFFGDALHFSQRVSEKVLGEIKYALEYQQIEMEAWHPHVTDFLDVDQIVARSLIRFIEDWKDDLEQVEDIRNLFFNLSLWESANEIVQRGEATCVDSAAMEAVFQQVRSMAEIFLSDRNMKTLTVAAYRSKGLTQEEAETAAALDWMV